MNPRRLAENRERRRGYRATGIAADDPRHGQPTGYQNWGCRCPKCKAAQSEYRKIRKNNSKNR